MTTLSKIPSDFLPSGPFHGPGQRNDPIILRKPTNKEIDVFDIIVESCAFVRAETGNPIRDIRVSYPIMDMLVRHHESNQRKLQTNDGAISARVAGAPVRPSEELKDEIANISEFFTYISEFYTYWFKIELVPSYVLKGENLELHWHWSGKED